MAVAPCMGTFRLEIAVARRYLSLLLSVGKSIPTLFFVLIIYNVVVFASHKDASTVMGAVQLHLPLLAAPLAVTTGDIIVLIGVILMFVEVVKSTVASDVSIIEHGLSTLSLTVFLVELLLVARAATSTFLILTAMQLADVVAGFAIGMIAARRDVGIHYYQ